MDAYRFGLFDVERIDEDTLNNVFDYFGDAFLDLERKVLRLKHLEYLENKDIAQKLGIDLIDVNHYASHFN